MDFDGTPEACLLLERLPEPDGRASELIVAGANRQVEELVGLRSTEIVGRRLRDVAPADRADAFLEKCLRVLESARPLEEEFAVGTQEAGWWRLRRRLAPAGDTLVITLSAE